MASLRRQIEDAFIALLSAQDDTREVRRWMDQSQDQTYPVYLVHCTLPPDETESADARGTLVFAPVEIAARTWTDSDADRSTVDAMAEQVRTLLESATLEADVTDELTGYTVLQITIEASGDNDEDRVSAEQYTAVVHLQQT